MSEWTDILDGIADHITLLKELGERSVDLDPEPLRALSAPPGARTAPSATGSAGFGSSPLPPAQSGARAPSPAPASMPAPRAGEAPALPTPLPALPTSPRAALADLAARADACEACALRSQRTRCVPGQGNPAAPDIMFIGEAPGADEDREGLAFVGAAGQFLTKMIEAMGYTRDDVFIANICKCRPPNNRPPQPEEIRACLPFLRDQIRIIRPKAIVLLGNTAIRGLLETQAGVTRLQGEWSNYEGIPVMPTYHPAYVLRFESLGDAAGLKKAKLEVWRALKRVLAHLGRPVPPPVKK